MYLIFNNFNMCGIQEIRNMTFKKTSNTRNTLWQTTTNVHSVIGKNDTDVFLRNKTLKDRLLERNTDDAVTLPIHEFRYERCYIYLHGHM